MKTSKIIFWTTMGFIFLFEGMMPLSTLLFAPEYVNVGTRPLGYPDYFAVTLIIFKVVGVFILIIPRIPERIKEWAYAGFMFNFVFATISHIAVDGFVGVSFFPMLILGILAISYFYHHKLQANG